MNARRVLRVCGLLCSVLALAWVVAIFFRGDGIAIVRSVPISPLQLIAMLFIGAFAYALAMCLPALAWWRLLAALSPQPPPPQQTMAIYAVTQYGKYLPGNVAHYALRHAWSRRHGIPHESLGLAAVLETALLMLAAFSLTLVADTHGKGLLSFLDSRLVVASLLLALILLWVVLRWIQQRGSIGRLHIPTLPPLMLLVGGSCYAGFFLLCASLMCGLASAIDLDNVLFLPLLAATAASWLAGFVIIGAPAGIGVREAAFVALAGTQLGEGHALLLIGLFRVITFLGDTLLLAAGTLSLRLEGRRSGQGVG